MSRRPRRSKLSSRLSRDSKPSRSAQKSPATQLGPASRTVASSYPELAPVSDIALSPSALSPQSMSALGALPRTGSIRGLYSTGSLYGGRQRPWQQRHLLLFATLCALLLTTCSVTLFIALRHWTQRADLTTPSSRSPCAHNETQLSVVLESLGVTVRGRFSHSGTQRTFFGIPYGADTGGANRFQIPKNRTEMGEGGVFNAYKHGPHCPQDVATGQNTSEDCLTLSIWAPLRCNISASSFVVLVVLSSEWFQRGYLNEYENIWERLSVSGRLVVVSINHRVGILGFLDAGIPNTPGNLGIHDAHLALSWIAEHIHAFGGDPNSLVGFGHGSGAYIASLDLFAPTWHRRRFFKRLILHGISPASLLPLAAPNFFSSVAASLQCDHHGDPASSIACISDLPLSQIYRDPTKQHPLLFMPSCNKDPVGNCDDMLQELPVFLQHREIMCGFSKDDGYRFFDRVVMKTVTPVPAEPSAVFDQLQRIFTGMPPKHEFKSLPPEALRVLNRSDLQGFRDLVVDMVLKCPLMDLARNAVLKGTLAYMYASNVPTVTFEPALTTADITDFAITGRADWRPFSAHSSVLVVTRFSNAVKEWDESICSLANNLSRTIFRRIF